MALFRRKKILFPKSLGGGVPLLRLKNSICSRVHCGFFVVKSLVLWEDFLLAFGLEKKFDSILSFVHTSPKITLFKDSLSSKESCFLFGKKGKRKSIHKNCCFPGKASLFFSSGGFGERRKLWKDGGERERRARAEEGTRRVMASLAGCAPCFFCASSHREHEERERRRKRRRRLCGKRCAKKKEMKAKTRSRKSQATMGDSGPLSGSNRTVKLIDLSDKIVPYQTGWQMQKDVLQKQLDAETALTTSNYGDNEDDHIEKILFEHDALIVLQHEKVITLGAGSTTDNLKFNIDEPPKDLGFEVHRCERGGEVTVHLPGQLVLYPILKLDQRKGASLKPDLHEYMRNLEEVALLVASSFGVEKGHREDGLTGAWANGAKFAQVGVRARRWVTYHGLAINIDCDLVDFTKHVVPCGIGDRQVGSIQERLLSQRQRNSQKDESRRQQKVSVEIAADRAFDAFEKVFDVSLVR